MSKPINHLQIIAFLATSALGISFLVFLNAAQPFVLRQIVQLPSERLSRVSSTLIFCDELLALFMVLVWGRLADTLSPRLVTALANLIVALALVLFVQVKSAYPGLLLIRLLFSIGASGITTMLSASLSILSSSHIPPSESTSESDSNLTESQPLLGWRRTPPTTEEEGEASLLQRKPAALSAFLGISAGTGALLAVFVFLRIPTWFSTTSPPPSPSSKHGIEQAVKGLNFAFYTVAGVALLNSIISFFGLPSKTQNSSNSKSKDGSTWWTYVRHEIAQVFHGFRLAGKNANVALACAGGFAARAQTISVSAFVPLYVASYYFKRGLCDPSSPEELKQSCHEAYALASAISGVTQLVALLSGIIFVWITRLSRTLAITSLLGCISFALLGRSAFGNNYDESGGENPKNVITWIAALGIGFAQTGSVTLSLALIAKERAKMQIQRVLLGNEIDDAEEDDEDDSESEGALQDVSTSKLGDRGQETAGALAGAYSFCGGLGVLSVSALAGILSNKAPAAAPFLGISAIDLLLAVGAIAVALRTVP